MTRSELRAAFLADELDKQHLTTDDPNDPYQWSGWLCTASGCLEDITDSYGECVHCGEPVVRVWSRG